MKKLLAIITISMWILASAAAQTADDTQSAGDSQTPAQQPAFVLAPAPNGATTTITNAASNASGGGVVALASPQGSPTAVNTSGSAATNYLAKFSSASDVEESVIFDSSTNGMSGSLGIAVGITGQSSPYFSGTNLPLAPLHVVAGTNPGMFVDVYSSAFTALPVVYRTAHGVPGTPSGMLQNDYIGGMAGRGYYGTTSNGGWTSGRASIAFAANENWTGPTNTSTYIDFRLTPTGATNNNIAMRLTSTGALGIGTTSPGNPLTVVGQIQSVSGTNIFGQPFTGGFVFPDNTVQTTAFTGTGGGVYTAGPGLSLSNNQFSVPAGTFQAPITQSCGAGTAMTGVGTGGTVTCTPITLPSTPVVVAQTSFTGGYGLGATNTIYTAGQNGAFYRVTVYMNVPTTGSCSSAPCAGEAITLQWNDGVSTTALATSNCNLVTPCASSSVTPMWVAGGQSITAYGQIYGTGNPPGGSPGYNAYVLVEKLTP